MNRAALAVMLAASLGCTRHPALVVGATMGAVGFGTCEIDDARTSVCAATGAIAGVFFGVLTAVLYHFTDADAHQLPPDTELGTDGTVHLHTFTPPPPMPLDAGIEIDAPAAPTIVIDAAQPDAGV